MKNPLNSLASFRSISLTTCVSKLFERIILSHLLFFLESRSILSPSRAGFRPERSALDQILFLSQFIWDGFNKSMFLGVSFDCTLSFSKHVSLLKAKFFPRLMALRCISASSWGPSEKSLFPPYQVFLRPLLTYASPGCFFFLSVTNTTNRNASTEWLVAPSPAASRPPLSRFFSPRIL